MFDENMDLKIVLAFTNLYEEKYNKGEISAEQLDAILSLLDNYNKYETEEFEKKVKEIFE